MKHAASPSSARTPVTPDHSFPRPRSATSADDACCPACGAAVVQEKCKVVCRSEVCTYRIVCSCSEF